MLSRTAVEDGYRRLCGAFNRKPKDDQIDVWWDHLMHRIDGEQFAAGVEGVIEHERTFPALATVIEYAHTYRGREKGTPYLYGKPLREVLDDIEARRSPLEFGEDPPGFWPDETTRLEHLNAVERARDEAGGLAKPTPGAFLRSVLDKLKVEQPSTDSGMTHVLDDEVPF